MKLLGGIVIPFVSALRRSFFCSEKIPYPMTVSNLWNQIPSAVSSAFGTEKELPPFVRYVYYTVEV
jgi:hypothetical protein